MFNKKSKESGESVNYQSEIEKMKQQHEIDLKELQSDHRLALKEKEFELKHFKDDEIMKLKQEINKSEQENAVLKKENEMLIKITDLNADVIDVKELVTNLINKLPEIKIDTLSLNQKNGDNS